MVFEDVREKESLKDVKDHVIRKSRIGLKYSPNEPVVLLLPTHHMEDQSIEHAVVFYQERLQLDQQIFAVGQEVDTLERQLEILTSVELLIEFYHVAFESLHNFQQGLVVLQIVFFVAQAFRVKGVDVDRCQYLHTVDGFVLLAHLPDLRQVGLKASLQESQHVLLIVDRFALFLDGFLFSC